MNRLAVALRQRARQAQRVALTSLELLALATWPSCYRGTVRDEVARQLWRNTWPQLPGFAGLAALLGVVLIHIVLVTADSYGLSRYALEVVVRVLALELLPLLAALFVALRCSLPMVAELMAAQVATAEGSAPDPATDPAQARLRWLVDAVFPRTLAVVFTVWLLVAVSALLALVLAYLMVHGWSVWGAVPFAHMVGRVFTPGVVVVFLLKTLAFSVAVGVVPMANVAATQASRASTELAGLARLTGVLLVCEVLSLLAHYD
jgi:phospholipid/cholesterol/gamma-HCH transport system permease protein